MEELGVGRVQSELYLPKQGEKGDRNVFFPSITRHACDDVPIPEEQETEGQRQLHNLLLQQLDTDVNIDR